MAERFLRMFELVLYGRDVPNGPRKHPATAASENSDRDSIVDPESPSKISQPSPTHHSEKSDAGVSEHSLPSANNDAVPAMQRSATWRTVSSLINPRDSHTEASWSPTAFHIRPLSGLAAIAVAVACVFGSLAILVVSDNSPVDQWPVTPTVFLAIVTAVANSSLAIAHAQAKPITWWYRASRGASARALESHWHTTNTLGGAIYYGRMSLLTVACIATSLAIIDGPLLQKASTVRSATVSSDVTLHLQLLPEVTSGFSGAWRSHEVWYNEDAYLTLRNWTLDNPIKFQVPECKGSCNTGKVNANFWEEATVQAPGVAKRECTSQTWPITSDMMFNFSATWGSWTLTASDETVQNTSTRSNPAFYVNLVNGQVPGYPAGAAREGAYLTVGIINIVHNAGTYIETNCWLNSAVAEYDIIVDDNTIKFDGNTNQGRLVRLANNTAPANISNVNEYQPTTLDGITEWLSMFVNANASVAINSAGGKKATFSPDYSTYNPVVAQHMDLFATDGEEIRFLDPTDSVIFKYNQIMFRGGVMDSWVPDIMERGHIDPDLSLNQTVTAKQTLTQNVFKSDLRWYGGATAIELITVLLVLPMFWGWWTLGGTNYTMSPLTMALAFDSPLLADVNSAAGAKGVVRQVGNIQLKFGLVSDTEPALESTNSGQEVAAASGRLGMAEASGVIRPRKGMQFTK